jgi:hypothetical protein
MFTTDTVKAEVVYRQERLSREFRRSGRLGKLFGRKG